MWGFSASPLVIGPLVIVYGGGGDKGLLAFDAATGDLRWSAPCPGDSYGSAQLNKLFDEDSVLVLTKSGLTLLDPATGKTRLDYEWKIPQFRALQPHVVGSDTILLPTGMNMGTTMRQKRNMRMSTHMRTAPYIRMRISMPITSTTNITIMGMRQRQIRTDGIMPR